MSNKMTNVKALTFALENYELPADVAERFTAMKASFEKQASRKSTAPTKAQKENAVLVGKILEAMKLGVQYGSADVAGLVPELADATPQKISPLMNALVKDGKVAVSKVKSKNVYTLAE